MNFLLELKEGLLISWAAIRANKLRSVLTTLGIIIGILTVTLMGTAIQGLNRAFLNSVSIIGADVLYVSRQSWFVHTHEEWLKMRKRRELNLSQSQAFARQLTCARAVSIMASRGQPIRRNNILSDNVEIVGANEDFMRTTGFNIAEGRFLTSVEVEGGRPVCVLGYMVATNLFTRETPIGHRVNIGGYTYEVAGVMERQGSFLDGGSLDNQAIIPLRSYMANFDPHPDFQLAVKVNDIHNVDEAKEEVRTVMRRVRHVAPGDADDFSINQQEQILGMFHAVAGTIAAIGLFITGLSLFVGGIGIMNIMFVSVAERTREIGIRKAIGAKRRAIMSQFLSEAASICLLGGIVALLIAWPATLLMNRYFPTVLSIPVAALAVGVSIFTGVVSGFVPAWRAARMNPVDALRNE